MEVPKGSSPQNRNPTGPNVPKSQPFYSRFKMVHLGNWNLKKSPNDIEKILQEQQKTDFPLILIFNCTTNVIF